MTEPATIPSDKVLDLLTRLVDASLVVYEEQPDGTGRYRLLETTRQYAGEKLKETGGEATIWEWHRDHYHRMVIGAETELYGLKAPAWLDRLEMEYDNIRAALTWCITTPGEADTGLQMAVALWRFWEIRGYLSEGREFLSGLLIAAGTRANPGCRAKALNAAGALAYRQGEYASAGALHRESLALFRKIGDDEGIAWSLGNLGVVVYNQGDYAAAHALYEESLALFRRLGNRIGIALSLNKVGNVACDLGDYDLARSSSMQGLALFQELSDKGGVAWSLNTLGTVDSHQGNWAEARTSYEEGLALRREIGNKQGIASSLYNLGNMNCYQGNYGPARSAYEESIVLYRAVGDRGGIACSLEAFAYLAFVQEQPNRTALLWGAAEALRDEVGGPRSRPDRRRFDNLVGQVRSVMGENAFSAAWSEGRAMDLEQAIACALQETGGE